MKFGKTISIILALFFLISISFFYLGKTHQFRFVDEEDNFSIGKYGSQGEKIYDDIATNHQPLTYIFSATVQKLSNIDSTYLLISRHRQFMIIWAIAWSLILVWFFGSRALFFVLIYELTKIQLLGNLFLAESQVVYPLVFMIGSVFFRRPANSRSELFFWGICFGLSVFLLSPIWPALLFLILVKTYQGRSNLLRTSLFKDAGILAIALIVFYFSSLTGYLEQAIFDNFKYTVPTYQSEPFIQSAIKSFLTPVLAFFPYPSTVTLWVIRIGLIILARSFIKKKLDLKRILALFFVLGLMNLRFIWPGTEGYSGFHFLPWYATLIFIVSQTVNFRSRICVTLLVLLFGIIFFFSRGTLFLQTADMADYNKNYSTQTSLGEAIRIIKGENDTLFVSPLSSLIYWQADTKHLPRLYGYYPWMIAVPKLHEGVLNAFETDPPTFFYCDNCLGLDLEKYLTKYDEVKRDSGRTYLYVLKSKVKTLINDQKAKLNYYKYQVN